MAKKNREEENVSKGKEFHVKKKEHEKLPHEKRKKE